MNEILYWLFGYWIELVKIYFIMTSVFRCKIRLNRTPIILAFSVVITFFTGIEVNNTYISGFIMGITMLTILIMLYEKREVLLAILGFIIISIIDVSISGIVGSLIDIRIDELLDDYLLSTMLNMQSLIPLMLLTRFLNKKKIVKGIPYSNKSLIRIFLISIGLFSVILFFVPFQVLNLNINSRNHKVSLLALTVSVLAFITMAVANVIGMMKNEQNEKDNEEYKYLLEKQKQLYGNLLEYENETKSFRHDVYHHMNCIKEYLSNNQTENAISYIESVYGLIKYSIFISTGNICLDIVINDVWKEYREKVSLDWSGFFPPETIILDIDICILFSNLFKNALEATMESGEKRKVCAMTKMLGLNIVFTLSNPYNKVHRDEKGKLRSTKSLKRGYGLRNMQEIVNKYGGNIELRAEELFVVEIILVNVIKRTG